MDIHLTMSNMVAILAQHPQHPINPAEPLIHRTIHPRNIPRTNLNLSPTTRHNLLMEGPRIRNQLMAHLQTPNSHPTEASNTKTLMEAINLNNTHLLLTSNKLTAHLQPLNNRLMEVFNIKIPMEVTKGPHPYNTHHLQVIKEVLDTALLLLVTFLSRNTSISKVYSMQNILEVCMAVLALVALPYPAVPIHTTARMHLLRLNTVRLLINMVDSKDGNISRILGLRGRKVTSIFRERFCI
jgi:hypothetical protein